MEKARKKTPNFRIQIPGDENAKRNILDGLQKVRDILCRNLRHPVNNCDIMESLLHNYLHDKEKEKDNTIPNFCTFKQTEKKDVDQKIFLTAESSVTRLCEVAGDHSKICEGKLAMKKITLKGHATSIRLSCTKDKHHSIFWSSSPYLPDNYFFVNYRVFHGKECSGILPIQYKRFTEGTGLGQLTKDKRKTYFDKYKNLVSMKTKCPLPMRWMRNVLAMNNKMKELTS
ncbi:hypothetical protein KP79_PYT23454 [Mizuhopecten yessoensis]|uniref:Uncharacterized protein n=1 Tax=Mizuhopecten yessoensis TaxID=6573 RepID=A0A210QFA9_MIZYE|nr:hypothetical protein KP79_PYT23454 [Mizuhopecten yessoensis]